MFTLVNKSVSREVLKHDPRKNKWKHNNLNLNWTQTSQRQKQTKTSFKIPITFFFDAKNIGGY